MDNKAIVMIKDVGDMIMVGGFILGVVVIGSYLLWINFGTDMDCLENKAREFCKSINLTYGNFNDGFEGFICISISGDERKGFNKTEYYWLSSEREECLVKGRWRK